jgi:hypothetical protein
MVEFYVKLADEQNCLGSVGSKKPITVTGLSINGKLAAFTGVVLTLKNQQAKFPVYPLLVIMNDAIISEA